MPNCEGACDRGGGASGKPEIPTCDPAQAPLYPLGYGGATPSGPDRSKRVSP